MSTFEFRVIKASWGIAIDLTALVHRSTLDPVSEALTSQVGVVVHERVRLGSGEVRFLVDGLRRVASQLDDCVGPITIEVTDVSYVPTDYQVEGLEAAAIGWACEEFDVEPPPIEVTFDPLANRYNFNYCTTTR